MPLSPALDDNFHHATSDSGLPESFNLICQQSWLLCGEGVFSWSVFRFYRARLLTQSGRFDESKPFLLDLSYLRSLTGKQIVSTSMEEIARLFEPSPDQMKIWEGLLSAIIPDVSLGDRLLGWFIPGTGVQFFSANQPLGQIQDPEFARMFSAIWLDPRTRSPQLRQALIGQSQHE